MVAGSHLKPRSGVARINAPHQVASAGRRLFRRPKVSSTEVAPCESALTLLGETAMFCARPVAQQRMSNIEASASQRDAEAHRTSKTLRRCIGSFFISRCLRSWIIPSEKRNAHVRD